MRTDQQDHVRIRREEQPSRPPHQRAQGMRRGSRGHYLEDITLSDILHKLWGGLNKLSVALRYQFHRLTAGAFSDFKLPWYKIALVAIVLLIVTKKDIQFSINMKAPLGGTVAENGSQMSLVHPIALRQAELNSELQPVDEQKAHAYIRRFSKVAAAEMEKFGIPASIKMAQGILESQAGEHPQARQANNHFGAPLSGQHFNSAWENWRAHSQLLQNEYPSLFQAGTSYKQWARALEQSGYSTDKQYGARLSEIIEKFQLYNLDQF